MKGKPNMLLVLLILGAMIYFLPVKVLLTIVICVNLYEAKRTK